MEGALDALREALSGGKVRVLGFTRASGGGGGVKRSLSDYFFSSGGVTKVTFQSS